MPKEETYLNENSRKLNLSTFLLILAVDILNTFAELSFKKGAMATHIHRVILSNFSQFALELLSSGWLWTGILCYLIMFLLWITVLSRMDLSIAFLILSIDYLLVPLFSIVFLKESISLLRWVGIAFVMAGICFASWSAASNKNPKELNQV